MHPFDFKWKRRQTRWIRQFGTSLGLIMATIIIRIILSNIMMIIIWRRCSLTLETSATLCTHRHRLTGVSCGPFLTVNCRLAFVCFVFYLSCCHAFVWTLRFRAALTYKWQPDTRFNTSKNAKPPCLNLIRTSKNVTLTGNEGFIASQKHKPCAKTFLTWKGN